MAISRRACGTEIQQSHRCCCYHHDTNEGIVDECGSSTTATRSVPRRFGGIQPPSVVPFHARIIPQSWVTRGDRSGFRSIQSRTLFSFLPNDPRPYEDNDWRDQETGKTNMSMPSRQSDMDRIDHQKETQQLKQQVQLRKKEVFELLDSPIGSLDWSELSGLLQYLCETDVTIRHAFDVLDRAAKEPDAKSKITHEMVFGVVQQWLNGYVAQQRSIDKPHYQNHYHKNNANGYKKRDQDEDSSKQQQQQQRMLTPLNVWKRIHQYQKLGLPLESPTYHKIMEGTTHVKSKVFSNPNGPRLAETILEQLMEESKRKNPLIRPSAYPFTVAMLSWEQAAAYSPLEASREAPQRALALLTKLKSLYNSGWGKEFMPDKNAYRRVMNIFAHRGDGDQVEALLEDLYGMYLDHYENGHENASLLLPTTPFFSLVLYAWSKSKDPESAERAESILEHMLELEESGEIPTLKVQSNFFNIIMVCWSKQRTLESANKVQAIFDRLQSQTDSSKRPIGASYMALIKTWSRFDPSKAEEAFWQWKEQHHLGNCEMRIDSDLIRTLVNSWCKSKEMEAAERADKLVRFALEHSQWEPTTAVFNLAIQKWCQEKTLRGLERAQDLLDEMIDYHEANPNSDTEPNNLTYLPMVRSWAEIGQLEKAEELLHDFFSQKRFNDNNTPKSNHLDARIFNCVLKGWLSKASNSAEAANRAQDLLLQTPTYGVKPNYASFQYVLDAWRKHKGGSWERPRAEAVLALLDHEYAQVETKRELYLNLKRGWKLLSLQQ